MPAASPAVAVRRLTFRYPETTAPVLCDVSFVLERGQRCLLLGANGVGKSTLLRLMAGRHMLPASTIEILGRPAFHDTTLAQDVAFLGGPFPLVADISVAEILSHRPGIEPARRRQVMAILDIDPTWRLHRVSDGQRRRVQLLLDLERPLQLVLLDEVTAELDVLARADLLDFLRTESEQRRLTVVYASHVLEGLDAWATHLAFLSPGRMRCFGPWRDIPALRALVAAETPAPLHQLCVAWMREDRGKP